MTGKGVRAVGLALLCSLVASCDETPPPPCVEGLALDCTPLYDPPIFQSVFERTLRPSCGTGTNTCHTALGAKGGLVFEEADAAYSLLLGQTDGRHRVLPGDPACSPVMIRLESASPTFRMPPGPTALPAGERCAIAKWIAAGASR